MECRVEKITPPITDGTPGLVHQCVKDADHDTKHKCDCGFLWEGGETLNG